MRAQQSLQPDTAAPQEAPRPLDRPHGSDEVFGVWLTTRDLMRFLPSKSIGAARQWVHAHGILRRGNGTVARRDVERELHRMARKPRRVMHPRSLENLRGAKASR
jgi:hypothetical protein